MTFQWKLPSSDVIMNKWHFECILKTLCLYFSSDPGPTTLIKLISIPHCLEGCRLAFRCEQNKHELINSAPVISGEESLQGYSQSNLIQFDMWEQFYSESKKLTMNFIWSQPHWQPLHPALVPGWGDILVLSSCFATTFYNIKMIVSHRNKTSLS